MDTLEDFRKSIDNIDNAIVAMFAERFKITDKVGVYKAKNNLPAQDKAREAAQFERIAELATSYGLDAEFAKSYLSTVVTKVVENHRVIAKNLQAESNS